MSQVVVLLGDNMAMISRNLILLVFMLSEPVEAMCRDREAWAASDELAKGFFNGAEVFQRAKVTKVHHPSRRKEVASYIKTGDKHYSIFTLVDDNCQAVFRKRTRQGD